jgi:LPS export ABC transporter protein LptC
MIHLQYKSYLIKSIAISLLIAVLFSCSKKIEEVNRLYRENEDIPASETKDFKLIYTLQGDKVLILTAPVMLDFTHQKQFAYQYFPENLKIELINTNKNEKTIITADKAFVYKNPDLSELIGHVHIQGADGSSLKTNHLYWDAIHKHIFGEEKTILQQNDEKITGTGFDSSLDFKNVRLNKITGILKVEQSAKNQ